MNGKNIAMIAAVVVAAGAVLFLKQSKKVPPSAVQAGVEASAQQAKPLPRLVDLGAGRCIPCKKMAPILEDLKVTCEGKLEVVFIDVWEKEEEAKRYGINIIPTQIFFDAEGKERFRHEGFFSKADILAKWKELGVEL
jgi:thioredoxin 1